MFKRLVLTKDIYGIVNVKNNTEEILCYETIDPPRSFATRKVFALHLEYQYNSKTFSNFCENIIHCVIVYDERIRINY